MGIVELWPTGVRVGRLDHRDRGLQGEVQHGLRGQLDLLALAGGLCAPADSGACCGADGRTLAAARDGADNAPQDRASAYFFSGILAA